MRKTLMPSHARFAVLTLVLSSVLSTPFAANASVLSEWQYNPEQAALGFQIDPGITPRYFLMPNPLRVVVDLPNTALQSTDTDRTFSGDVSRIRVSEFKPGVTRMVMELAPNSVLQSGQVSLENLGNGQWQIRPLIEVSGNAVIAAQPATKAPTVAATASEAMTKTMPGAVELPVIVLNEVGAESEAKRSPSEVPDLSTAITQESIAQDGGVNSELLPPPRPTASAIAPLPTPKVKVPVLGSQPEAASFTTLINAFEPLPTQDDFVNALPGLPAEVSSDAGLLGDSSLSLGLPTVVAEDPAVPYMVEFGQPLPGVSNNFPAAYMRQ